MKGIYDIHDLTHNDHINYYENEKSDHNDLTHHSLTHLKIDYGNYEYFHNKLINHDFDNYKSDYD